MRSFRAAILDRRWPVLLALGLFLGGTNYCVAVAIAGPGARLACGMNMNASAAVPACHAALVTKSQALPPCHAHAAKASPAKARPAAPMPCCITLAPSASSPDAKPAAEIVAPLPAGLEIIATPLAPWREAPLELDTGPPSRLAGSPLSSRAPPLA